ncbi:MAG: glycoside hydrolase family 31 protein [Treponema sp.]|nr:glycoside hydrolase family 31 protein [Treponema sp.]MCL2272593.1 glycoside hydrolase family 31 protein [Treponema sp.]
MAVFKNEYNKLIRLQGTEILWIEAWGKGLRVRACRQAAMPLEDWALLEKNITGTVKIDIADNEALIINEDITAKINKEGWISFYNEKGDLLLEEYYRNRNNLERYCVPLGIGARELKPVTGRSDYRLTARFEAKEDEHIWGMGQYQDGLLDKKGASLELAHRNSQASIPFYVSSRGYGFLWNNPAVGRAVFAQNITEWYAECTDKMDYWITAGSSPKEIIRRFTDVTGKAPLMPEYGLGFWQSKLRYRTQEELLNVAHEHKRRGLPMDVIVVDFFHWPLQGDWKFDPENFPDPDGMVRELKEMGIELMVSIWPTVDHRSENFWQMAERGLLLGFDRGCNVNMTWMGDTVFYDATHPDAQKYVWRKVKENYFDKGIKIFWLDEAEPEGIYDFDIYRYHLGPAQKVTGIYPNLYAKGFYDGIKEEGIENPVNLVRCGWAGVQRYGALLWSGDVYSNFRSFREQIAAGLSIAMSGVPWWTSDIGGFIGGVPSEPDFQELLIRWFQFGCFSPVFRMHGERFPMNPTDAGYKGGIKQFGSGQDNEVWSYGENNFLIMKKYILMRERLRPYIRGLMKAAHKKGDPVIRPMTYEFPDDKNCVKLSDQYMFGPDLLCAPVVQLHAWERDVYLPAGAKWTCCNTGTQYEGGQTVISAASLDVIPLFARDGAEFPIIESTTPP